MSNGVGQAAWGLVGFLRVGLASGAFRRGGSVPIFNLEMGLPLKVAVACSEATIALGDAAATYLSAGFRPDFLVSTQVGAALGAFLGARVAALARVVRLVVLGVLLLAAANLLAP